MSLSPGSSGKRLERPFEPPAVLSKDSEDPILRLVEQIQAGTRVEENFAELFRQFRRAVHSYFLHKGFTSEESKDLTQDVFLRVFKRIGTFRRESRFERWLWEIVTNIYFNEIRRRKTEKRNGREEPLEPMIQGDDRLSLAETIPDDEPSPEDFLLMREQSLRLRDAFQALPNQMRRCCRLRYEQGLKYKEIAEIMQISIETVKAHLHQARKRLGL
jgi:RNA polymerase sigma-70 factor (ECF subfamily)